MKLLIQLTPSALLNTSFIPFVKELLASSSFQNHQFVFEICLHDETPAVNLLKKRVRQLKELGNLISINVSSIGISPFRHVIELEPHWIQLSKYFSFGLSESKMKQNVVQSFVESFRDDTMIGLKGIGQPEDLAMAKALGVKLGQGSILDKAVTFL